MSPLPPPHGAHPATYPPPPPPSSGYAPTYGGGHQPQAPPNPYPPGAYPHASYPHPSYPPAYPAHAQPGTYPPEAYPGAQPSTFPAAYPPMQPITYSDPASTGATAAAYIGAGSSGGTGGWCGNETSSQPSAPKLPDNYYPTIAGLTVIDMGSSQGGFVDAKVGGCMSVSVGIWAGAW